MHLSLRENASQVKNHLTAVLGETLGTAMFLFIVRLTLSLDMDTLCRYSHEYQTDICNHRQKALQRRPISLEPRRKPTQMLL
jgi:hypothetical protein